jgi:hypothetical protein
MSEINFSHEMKSSAKLIEKEIVRADLEIREKKLKRKPNSPSTIIEGDDNEKFLDQLLELKKQNKRENEEPETIWMKDPSNKETNHFERSQEKWIFTRPHCR